MTDNGSVSKFKRLIGMLESSGGRNTNHAPAEFGVSAGDTAEGEHGLMPKTKDELRARYPELKEDSPESEYTDKLAKFSLNRAGGDEKLAAALWRYGHNASPERFEKLSNSPYAKAYEKLRLQQNIPEALEPNSYYVNKENDDLNLLNDETKSPFRKIKKILGK